MPIQEKVTAESNQETYLTRLFVALGSAGGEFVADTFVYPFDTINTWIKMDRTNTKQPTLVKNMIKIHGMKSLYAGVNAQFPCIFLPSFIYYLLYEASNKFCRKFLDNMDLPGLIPFIPSITATFSEGCSLLIFVPMDGIRTRLQSGTFKYPSVAVGLKQTIEKEGIMRLFSASPIYLANTLIYNTCLFQAYEYFRIKWKREREVELKAYCLKNGLTYKKSDLEFNLIDTIKCTLIANSIAITVTNPLDVIITRYQIEDSSKKAISKWQVMKQMFLKEGFRGVGKGVTLKLFYTNVQSFIYIPIYEYLRQKYGYDFSD